MLVSMPWGVALKAGLQRDVQIRVGQDPELPGIITPEALNQADRVRPL